LLHCVQVLVRAWRKMKTQNDKTSTRIKAFFLHELVLYIYLNSISHKRELDSKVEVCLQVVITTTDNGANFVKAFRVYGPAENEAVTIDLYLSRR